MNGTRLPKSAWQWYFLFLGIFLVGVFIAIGIKNAPKRLKKEKEDKEDVEQQRHIPATKHSPPALKQEKWVFGFSADFEQIKAAAAKNLNLSPGRECEVTFFSANEKEIAFNFRSSDKKRTLRKARLSKKPSGYFEGVIEKEGTRKTVIYLTEDRNSPGNYVGYMQDWDAKSPNKAYSQVRAYLKRF